MTDPDPNVTPIDSAGLFNAVVSHAMRSGLFETVSGHEAMNAPANGIHYEVWGGPIRPITSGLNITSARIVIQGRIKINMNREPRDSVETDLLYTTDRMLASYTGQFQLALDDVRSIDVMGANGIMLEARPGYIDQDNHLFRICDITIPILVNDCWEQLA